MKPITVGHRHTARYPVVERYTVPRLFEDDEHSRVMPQVLATPYLVALVERASTELIAGHLEGNEGSLGISIELQHTSPTLVGMHVEIEIVCVAAEGRKLSFEFTARDEFAEIGKGRHDRAAVDWTRFEGKLDQVRQSIGQVPQ